MVNYALEDLFLEDSVEKQMKIDVLDTDIVIDNSKLYEESFSIQESLSSGGLVFGSCEASCISFTCENSVARLKGKVLEPSIVLNGNTDNPFYFGLYKVVDDVPQADRFRRDVLAYDFMYDIINANVFDWYMNVFPFTEVSETNEDGTTTVKKVYGSITLKQFRDSFFEHLGFEHREVNLVNDNMLVTMTIGADNGVISGKDIISAICEINGAFGRMGRDGVFEYVILEETDASLYPSNMIYPDNKLFPSSGNAEVVEKYMPPVEYSDFEVEKITQVHLVQDSESAGCKFGEEGNTYTVNNILTYGKSQEELLVIAENLLNVIKIVDYVPMRLNKQGNPCLQAGDIISVALMDGSVIDSYILERHLTGIQALSDYVVAEGEQYYSRDVNSVSSNMQALVGKVNILKRTQEENYAEVKDLATGAESIARQTATGLTTKVSKGDVSSEISQESDKVSIKSNRLVVESDNFELDEDGSVRVKGEIEATKFKATSNGTVMELTGGKLVFDNTEGGNLVEIVHVDSNDEMTLQFDNGVGIYSERNNGWESYIDVASGGIEMYTSQGTRADSSISMVRNRVDIYGNLYVNDSPISTSDENKKEDIKSIDDKYEEMFNSLEPVTYKFIDGTSGRTHVGFISQRVNNSMKKSGVLDVDFAGFCRVPRVDKNENNEWVDVLDESGNPLFDYALRYEEFIALNTHMIQKANKRIESLENEVEELKNLVNQLMNKGE